MTGEELRNARMSLGFTQKQLGDHLDVRQEYISRLENGHRPISHTIELAINFIIIANRRVKINENFKPNFNNP